ncbi:MAG TPA: DNA translocase FtsK [Chloroflexota bacterium]|nr:DNA translocase FtsK [Chloroflexota bacterium]
MTKANSTSKRAGSSAQRLSKPKQAEPSGLAVKIGRALSRLLGGTEPAAQKRSPAKPSTPRPTTKAKPAPRPTSPRPRVSEEPRRPELPRDSPPQPARLSKSRPAKAPPTDADWTPVDALLPPGISAPAHRPAERPVAANSRPPARPLTTDPRPLENDEDEETDDEREVLTPTVTADQSDLPADPDDEAAVAAEAPDEDEAPTTEPPKPRLNGVTRRYAALIEQTLAEFGAPGKVVHAEVGPMVIRFGVAPGYLQKPGRGGEPPRRERVRAAKIVSRSNDLALVLGVTSLRTEAPVPGKTFIGIEIPNPNPKPVPLPALLSEPEFQSLNERGVLPMALGRDVAGRPIVADLARQPHLLIAGATGSGKSVAVNSLLGTLLHTRKPGDVRVIVVDPKRVEFTWLAGLPHLLAPVATEIEAAVEILGKVETEMARRYDLLASAGCRNRLAYNAGHQPALPALVVVIDELADLMMLAAQDVERSICRLAQLGRAAGIHLVVATQRPSVDVITGLIKANLPARLAFTVASSIDSRTILDSTGAERLLGRGDFLYLPPDAMRPLRGQGTMARDSWLTQTVKAAKAAVPAGTPDPEMERFAKLPSAGQVADDKLYGRARELAQEHPKLSASFLQRKLRIGGPKATALIERLRADGVIADPELDDE